MCGAGVALVAAVMALLRECNGVGRGLLVGWWSRVGEMGLGSPARGGGADKV